MIRNKDTAGNLMQNKTVMLLVAVVVFIVVLFSVVGRMGLSITDFFKNIWGEKNETQPPKPVELTPIADFFPKSFDVRLANGAKEKYTLLDDNRLYFIRVAEQTITSYSIVEINAQSECKNLWAAYENKEKKLISDSELLDSFFGFSNKFKEEKEKLGDFPKSLQLTSIYPEEPEATLHAELLNVREYLIQTENSGYYVGEIYNDEGKIQCKGLWKADSIGEKTDPETWNIRWGQRGLNEEANKALIIKAFVKAQYEEKGLKTS